MPTEAITPALVRSRSEQGAVWVECGGEWRMTLARPGWEEVDLGEGGREVRVRLLEGTRWETSLVIWLNRLRQRVLEQG